MPRFKIGLKPPSAFLSLGKVGAEEILLLFCPLVGARVVDAAGDVDDFIVVGRVW